MYTEETLISQEPRVIGRKRESSSVNLNHSYHRNITVTKTKPSSSFNNIIANEFGSISNLYAELNRVSSKNKNWTVLYFDSNSLKLSVKAVNSEFELESNEFVLLSLFNDKSDSNHEIYHFIDWDEVEKNYRLASYI
jgi:superoxide dismutase